MITLDRILAALDDAALQSIKKQFAGLVLQVDSDDGLLERDFEHFTLGLSRILRAHDRARQIASEIAS